METVFALSRHVYDTLNFFLANPIGILLLAKYGGPVVLAVQAMRKRRPVEGGRHFPGQGDVPAHWVHHQRGSLEVGMTFPTPFRFRLDRETAIDRMAKQLGLSGEPQVGDRAFDDEVYLCCDDRWLAETLAHRPAARAAVRDGIRVASAIEGDGRLLWMRFDDEVPEAKAVAIVAAIRSTLLPVPPTGSASGDAPLRREAVAESVLAVLAGAACLFGVAGLLDGAKFAPGAPVLSHLAAYCAVALLALLFVVSRLLGRSAWSHRLLLGTGWVGVLALPMGTLALVTWANARFDRSAGRQMLVRVAMVESEKGRVSFYREDQSEAAAFFQDVRVPASVAGSIAPGRYLTVEVGDGALGLPYFRDVNGK